MDRILPCDGDGMSWVLVGPCSAFGPIRSDTAP